MKTFQSFSARETKKFGEQSARRAVAKTHTKGAPHRGVSGERRTALTLALAGGLGAGKTTFVQGFFRGLGLKKAPASPTFIIMRRRPLRQNKYFSNIFHVDAYRLKKAGDMKLLGFKDILADPRNIVLVEWAEKIRRILPKDAVWLRFRHGKKENERHITAKLR